MRRRHCCPLQDKPTLVKAQVYSYKELQGQVVKGGVYGHLRAPQADSRLKSTGCQHGNVRVRRHTGCHGLVGVQDVDQLTCSGVPDEDGPAI